MDYRNLLEKHPMPWSTTIGNHGQFLGATVLVDASGKEIDLDQAWIVAAISELSKSVTKKQKRKFGERPTGLFVVKNSVNGCYLNRRDITRTQHYKSRYQAQKCAERLNSSNPNTWVVKELDIKEKE